MSVVPEINPTNNGHCFVVKFLKSRVLEHFWSEPALFCFILSLFMTSAALAVLGVYIEVDHMPDLDAMKNWNAYVGRLGEPDYCFQVSSSTRKALPPEFVNGPLHQYCSSSVDNSGNCSLLDELVEYATVGVMLNFTLHRHLVNQSKGIFSTFSGKDARAQIKDQNSHKRIEDCIRLDIWIKLFDVNITQACVGDQCTVAGCLLITAPLTAIPTRMAQMHKNFTFAAKVFHSKGRPGGCGCAAAELPGTSDLLKVDLLHGKSNCTASDKPVVKLLSTHRWTAKGYSVIKVDLGEEEKRMASRHMCVTALALACLGLALTVAILFTAPAPVEKKSQA